MAPFIRLKLRLAAGRRGSRRPGLKIYERFVNYLFPNRVHMPPGIDPESSYFVYILVTKYSLTFALGYGIILVSKGERSDRLD